MKSRRIYEWYDDKNIKHTNLIWFKSYGKTSNGKAKFVDSNFDENLDAIKSVLIQQLSTLENELWYDMLYGLPLLNKEKSKYAIDSKIISIINSNNNVTQILEFNSNIKDKNYYCYIKIKTNFGEIELNI